MIGFIYVIRNVITNKCYVGSSIRYKKRFNEHKRLLKKGQHANYLLQQSFDFYGLDCFSFEVVLEVDVIDGYQLKQLETEYIKRYKSNYIEYGYNVQSKGEGTSSSDFSNERKQRISQSLKGRVAHNKGTKMSNKQRELLKRVKVDLYGFEVEVYDVFGKYIETIKSITECAEKYQTDKKTVIWVCKNKVSHYKGYIFQYTAKTLRTHKIKLYNKYTNRFFYKVTSPTGEESVFLEVKEVRKCITGSTNRHSCIEKFARLSKVKGKVEYKGYTIEYCSALPDSNVRSEIGPTS